MAPHTLEEDPLEAQTKVNSRFHRSYRLMMWIHISKFVNRNRERYEPHIPYFDKISSTEIVPFLHWRKKKVITRS